MSQVNKAYFLISSSVFSRELNSIFHKVLSSLICLTRIALTLVISSYTLFSLSSLFNSLSKYFVHRFSVDDVVILHLFKAEIVKNKFGLKLCMLT